MAIELTEQEKANLRRRTELRAAQATFRTVLETDQLGKSSKTKLRKGKAQKRAEAFAALTTYGAPRTASERRVDAYIKRERIEFFESRAWKAARYAVLKRDGGVCRCCGAKGTPDNPIQVDHIKPRSKHPELSLVLSNLQLLCKDCNEGKGSWDESDWRTATLGLEKGPA